MTLLTTGAAEAKIIFSFETAVVAAANVVADEGAFGANVGILKLGVDCEAEARVIGGADCEAEATVVGIPDEVDGGAPKAANILFL